jgi:hypothetical protein
MFLSLLINMIDSRKPNVQTMCQKNGMTPLPMPVIAPAGKVSFI